MRISAQVGGADEQAVHTGRRSDGVDINERCGVFDLNGQENLRVGGGPVIHDGTVAQD